MVRAIVAFVLCVMLPSVAMAKRVALVIGNSAYVNTPALINPRHDAADMSIALKKLDFEVVEGFDLEKSLFDRKVRDFADKLSGAKVAVFFYAGHGLQVAGHNYLVPIDAKLSSAAALDWEMVRLDLVQRTMERETETNVLFLDACRDNPLGRNLARAMGTRSTDIGRGLAATEAGVGTLISFSTQPGNVALDGTGRNSPFAGALVKRMASSNDDLSALLIDVRNDVRKETQNKQVPWEHSALTGRFYFNAAPAPLAGSPPQVSAGPAPQLSEAERTWPWIKDSTDQNVLDTFIRQFGDTTYGALARSRLDALKKQQTALATPPPAPKAAAAPQVAPAPSTKSIQSYPTGPLKLIVPFAAGGPTDIVARVVSDSMSRSLGQPVVTENIPGAGGMIGSSRVAKGTPDGRELLLGTVATHAISQSLYSKPQYNAAADFEPVALVAEMPLVLAVSKQLPAASLKEFIDYAKANKGRLSFASGGLGTVSHLGCSLLNSALGIDAVHVPYRGTSAAMNDLIAGSISHTCETALAIKMHVDAGSLKVLAVLSKQRLPLLPDLPTTEEQGAKGIYASMWHAFFVTKGTPPEVIRILSETVMGALKDDGVKKRLGELGAQAIAPGQTSPDYLRSLVKSETDRWALTIKTTGARLD